LTLTLALSQEERGTRFLASFSLKRGVGEGLPRFVRRAEVAYKFYRLLIHGP